MSKIEENIQKWETLFTTYLEFENKCSSLLNEIQVIKNNLKKLLGNQKQDDLLFYKSMIDNSYFFFTNSLKIKKLKLIKDLNHIWSELDSKKTVDELTIQTFQNIIKDYKRGGNISLYKKVYSKNILGKKRVIYKARGSNKEYIKRMGEYISVKEYKKSVKI